jgi:hypothetical protein
LWDASDRSNIEVDSTSTERTDMDLKEVRVPKSSFRSERDTFYSDWTLAFWREFFQNSVDAGAKNIAISISTEKARGSFNLDADTDENVTRIVFDDDGKGMTADVLSNVYFAIGESTKGTEPGSVGGFGRARLMTCFSQKRYSIITGDSFVMGDGPHYVLYDLKAAERQVAMAIEKLRADGGQDVAIEGLAADRQLIGKAFDAGGRKGCRVEVDLDHVGTRYSYRLPTESVMANRLKEYLSESQISANVTINGKSPEDYFKAESKLQARRGPVKRTLLVESEEGAVEFATVHQSEGAKAAHKGRMIVRVDGASMYAESINAPEVQVILEIKTDMSRSVLNSNRDGIRDPYRSVVSGLLQELATDNISALAEKASKTSYRIAGDKGLMMSSKAVDLSKIVSAELKEGELRTLANITITATPTKRYQNIDSIRAAGVSQEAIEAFLEDIRWGSGFANGLGWNWEIPQRIREQVSAIREGFYDRSGSEIEYFMEKVPDGLREWIVDTLAARIAEERAKLRQEEAESRLKDQTDVYMHIVKTNDKTKAALARHHPTKWDTETGKGRLLKSHLASWTAACSVAIETLRKVRPGIKDFNWMTGFVLALPEQTYEGDSTRLRQAAAMYHKDEKTEASVYLMNPFNEDGSLAFRLTSAQDRKRMITNALHEVAHTAADYHNEAYALTLTDMVEYFDFDEANRRMRQQERAVAAAYDKGKSRVQPMDDEPGPRPAERLLSLASGNQPNWAAVDYASDGTIMVDCDRIADNALEQEHSYADETETRWKAG